MKNVFYVACISGMIAVAIVLIIFWVIFPTAWVFFIIPAVVGWSIDRFGTFDATKLENEEEFTATARKVGLTCAAIVLACIIISVLPLFFTMSVGDHLMSIMFYVICAISVYWAYKRGVQCVTDAYYESQS